MSTERIFSIHWILMLAKLFSIIIDPCSQIQSIFVLSDFRNQTLDSTNCCALKHSYFGGKEKQKEQRQQDTPRLTETKYLFNIVTGKFKYGQRRREWRNFMHTGHS